MGDPDLTQRWRRELFRILEAPETGAPLKDAALAASLGDWTGHLTRAVVLACEAMGWQASARGFLGRVLPVPRSEYLAIDVMAFPEATTRWPMPVAAFELENSPDDIRVAYSLWKVLCVRSALRVVFAYRRDREEGIGLVSHLNESVVASLPLDDRLAISGETSIILGNRGGAETFPYGYFQVWTLNINTGRFERA
jgi:hypothetical protein